MCGIAGLVADNCDRYKDSTEKMVESIAHRGPDGGGIFYYKNCALGHRRLSIVDLGTGHQPMHSPLSKSTIVFNGEIYGYQDIKRELSDYPYQTKSDTEVILALYDKYNVDMMDKLPGMFSFAIWNEEHQELFCARDRFGEKPFYYAWGRNGEFIFASEIKAILSSGLIEPVLDLDAVGHYLKYKYIHPGECVYKNVYTLPPAHKLLMKNKKIKIDRYWEMPAQRSNISFDDAVYQFDYLLKKSIKNQLVADVPVGAFLSGGLDSSSIVIDAKEIKPDIKTFSFGFTNSHKNELPYAKAIAEHSHTDHTELTDDTMDISDLLIKMQTIYDEPFADSSNIPTYLICQKAREHTKVVLSGDGGDELLAGYTTYRRIYDALSFAGLNSLQISFLKLRSLWDNNFDKRFSSYSHLMESGSVSEMHHQLMSPVRKIPLSQLSSRVDFRNRSKELFNSSTIDDALRIDLSSYMPGDILVKTDRAAMANGLELRAPFLDKELAEFCISLPTEFKINDKTDKLLLRECFKNRWPEKVINRKKQGFGAPLDKWMKLPKFEEMVNWYISDRNRKIFSIFDFDSVHNQIHKNDNFNWIMLNLSIWMESHQFVLGGKS